jgi:hypothetical protein
MQQRLLQIMAQQIGRAQSAVDTTVHRLHPILEATEAPKSGA